MTQITINEQVDEVVRLGQGQIKESSGDKKKKMLCEILDAEIGGCLAGEGEWTGHLVR